MQKATSKKAQPKSPAAGAKRKLTRAEKKQIAEVIQTAKGDGKPHTAQQTKGRLDYRYQCNTPVFLPV